MGVHGVPPLTGTLRAYGSSRAVCCNPDHKGLEVSEKRTEVLVRSRVYHFGLTCLAQQARIARQAEALQGLVASAVLAARHGGAFGASASSVSDAAAALSRCLAVASRAVAATPAGGYGYRVSE